MSIQTEVANEGIQAYLAQHERKEMLRFLTCGSVDDGKSTLIGRLLHDSKQIYEDQLAAVKKDSVKSGTTGGEMDLALLVDGLQAEREQGITIDVAYRYFSTARRKFIIADTPGHEQYTRNMVTGASTCDLAIILVDARYGVQTQTKRHSFIVSLLGIKHIIIAINKMDLVGYREAMFNMIRREYLEFIESLEPHDIRFIPISALKGDNVVNLSTNMPWYKGEPLMEVLDTIDIVDDQNFTDLRFPVQYVNRPNLNFRGYSGTLAAGVIHRGEAITALPSHKTSRIKSIVTQDGELAEAFPPQAITVTLEDEIDLSRGDMLVRSNKLPLLDTRFNAYVVWMTENPLVPGKQYYLKQTTKTVTGAISQIQFRIDVNTLERRVTDRLQLNEIGLCEVALNAPLAFDPYTRCKGTGSFILIDRLANLTVGAGMIVGLAENTGEARTVTPEERAARFSQKAVTLSLTGKNSRTFAYRLERKLFDLGHASAVLDDESLGATAALIADSLNQAGLICIHPSESSSTVSGSQWSINVEELSVDDLIRLLRQKGVL